LNTDGTQNASMDVTHVYKHLGTGIGALGSMPLLVRQYPKTGYIQPKESATQPQQRMRVQADNLIPKFIHQLTLQEKIQGNVPWDIDKKVGRSVREWLKLLHDMVTEFFLAKVRDEIPQLTVQGRLLHAA
jgi:hypothetical protein